VIALLDNFVPGWRYYLAAVLALVGGAFIGDACATASQHDATPPAQSAPALPIP
jgi:hypothetical protein